MAKYLGPLDEVQSSGPKYLGPLASDSNLPPFDIKLPPGADPEEEARKIVSSGIVRLGPLEEEPPIGSGVAHTLRAMAETGAGLAAGLAAFPIAKGTGLIELALTGGDVEAARRAEEKAASRIQFEPTTEEARGAMGAVGAVLNPIFTTLRQMGGSTGRDIKSPVVEYLGETAGEVGGAVMAGRAARAIKGEIPARPQRIAPKEEPIAKQAKPVDIIPEKPPVSAVVEEPKLGEIHEVDPLWYQGQRATKSGIFEDRTDAFFTKDPTEAEWYAGGLSVNPKDRISGGRVIAVRQSELEKRLGRSVGGEEIVSDVYPTAMKENVPIDSIVKTDIPALSERTKLRDPITGASKKLVPEIKPLEPGPKTKPLEGEMKESRLAVRTEADAIAIKLTEDFGDLVEYKTMSMKEQAARAKDVMDKDYEAAKRMAMGDEKPPEGIREATMYEAVKIRALGEGDVETLQKIATESTVPTRLSEYGQAIKAADSRLIDDPVKVMQEIAKTRGERSARITGKKEVPQPGEIAKLRTQVEELQKAFDDLKTSRAIVRIKNEIAKEQRQTKRVYAKQELKTEFDGLVKELNFVLGGQLSVGVDPTAALILGKMAKNRVRSGIITVEGLVDEIYTAVKNLGVELSERDIRDAISGYGITKQLSKEEVNVQLRELKSQMRLISAYEDAVMGEAPLRSGLQRDLPSDAVRELQRKVKEAMRESGIDSAKTRTPEEQWKTSLDAVKTRLSHQIADLSKQIETGQKTPKKKGIQYDAEAISLKEQRDALKKIIEEVEGKPEMSAEQRVKMATSAAERSIAGYERRITEKDLAPQKKVSKTPLTPELVALRTTRDALKKTYQEMQKEAKPHKTPEEVALQTFKTRTTNRIATIEKNLAGMRLEPKPRKLLELDPEARKLKEKYEQAKDAYSKAVEVAGTITKEEVAQIVELSKLMGQAREAIDAGGNRFTYGATRVAYENYVNGLKGAHTPLSKLIKDRWAEAKVTWGENKARAMWDIVADTIQKTSDTSVSIVATLDDSFLGRQGLSVLQTHPSAWWPAAVKSFSDFVKTVGGKDAHDALMADIYSRPNYLNGSYQKAKILTATEEQYPTSIPERIPGAGRVFRASQYAFTGSAIRMRTQLYDMLSKMATEKGVDMSLKTEYESLGKLINSLTARGQWGKRGEPPLVRVLLWAPKMLKANIDILTAHSAGVGLESSFARYQAARNLLLIVAETATVMMIANALKPGSAETNPSSSDFGKIKVGKTRFDITGGKAAVYTLAARMVRNSYKSTITGRVIPYETGFGKRTRFDALIDFIVNKAAPPAREVINWLKGESWGREKWTPAGALYRTTTPIAVQNLIELKDEASADQIAGVIADAFGVSANTYKPIRKGH